MGFFDSLKNGFEITKASLKVVSKDPEFLALPIIVGIIMIGVVVSFFLGNLFFSKLSLLFVALFYLISFSLSYFIQAMVLEGAKVRFAGGDPSLGQAFSLAVKKLDKIIALAVISAIVSILVRAVSERGEKQGGIAGIVTQLIAALIGASWTVVSYFSLPVILNEDIGVFKSFSRSLELFKKTWGENFSSSVSLLILYIPAIIFALLAIASLAIGLLILTIAFAFLFLLSLFLAAVIASVTKSIIAQALYEYASTGKVPGLMPQEQVKSFYKKK